MPTMTIKNIGRAPDVFNIPDYNQYFIDEAASSNIGGAWDKFFLITPEGIRKQFNLLDLLTDEDKLLPQSPQEKNMMEQYPQHAWRTAKSINERIALANEKLKSMGINTSSMPKFKDTNPYVDYLANTHNLSSTSEAKVIGNINNATQQYTPISAGNQVWDGSQVLAEEQVGKAAGKLLIGGKWVKPTTAQTGGRITATDANKQYLLNPTTKKLHTVDKGTNLQEWADKGFLPISMKNYNAELKAGSGIMGVETSKELPKEIEEPGLSGEIETTGLSEEIETVGGDTIGATPDTIPDTINDITPASIQPDITSPVDATSPTDITSPLDTTTTIVEEPFTSSLPDHITNTDDYQGLSDQLKAIIELLFSVEIANTEEKQELAFQALEQAQEIVDPYTSILIAFATDEISDNFRIKKLSIQSQLANYSSRLGSISSQSKEIGLDKQLALRQISREYEKKAENLEGQVVEAGLTYSSKRSDLERYIHEQNVDMVESTERSAANKLSSLARSRADINRSQQLQKQAGEAQLKAMARSAEQQLGTAKFNELGTGYAPLGGTGGRPEYGGTMESQRQQQILSLAQQIQQYGQPSNLDNLFNTNT